MLAKIINTFSSLIYKWVVEASKKSPFYKTSDDITEIEFDEMWYFIPLKNRLWVIKTVNRRTGKTIA